jgi:hypothetical protein
VNPGGLLNTPQRPSQSPQRNDLLFLFFAQDIHSTEGKPHVIVNVLASVPLAGFQVTLIGRFWVIPEGHCNCSAYSWTGLPFYPRARI